MVILWTFENKNKLNKFCTILKDNNICFETGEKLNRINELTVSVEDSDYKEAKKLLIKSRKKVTVREHKSTYSNI